MKFLPLLYAFFTPLKVAHIVDPSRTWRAMIANPSKETIITRIEGHVVINDNTGYELERYKVPLKGICLESGRSCMTSIPQSLPLYKEPVTLTCVLSFIDLEGSWKDSMVYFRRCSCDCYKHCSGR